MMPLGDGSRWRDCFSQDSGTWGGGRGRGVFRWQVEAHFQFWGAQMQNLSFRYQRRRVINVEDRTFWIWVFNICRFPSHGCEPPYFRVVREYTKNLWLCSIPTRKSLYCYLVQGWLNGQTLQSADKQLVEGVCKRQVWPIRRQEESVGFLYIVFGLCIFLFCY